MGCGSGWGGGCNGGRLQGRNTAGSHVASDSGIVRPLAPHPAPLHSAAHTHACWSAPSHGRARPPARSAPVRHEKLRSVVSSTARGFVMSRKSVECGCSFTNVPLGSVAERRLTTSPSCSRRFCIICGRRRGGRGRRREPVGWGQASTRRCKPSSDHGRVLPVAMTEIVAMIERRGSIRCAGSVAAEALVPQNSSCRSFSAPKPAQRA